MAALHLTGDKEADALLSKDPFALLIGMVLDQQVPMERAFSAPSELRKRLGGSLRPATVAAMDPGELSAIFAAKPALHRFPGSMAERVQKVAQVIVDEYKGDTAAIWNTAATGAELLKNLRALPGFGEQKAKIFLALLAKRLGVKPKGWQEVAGGYGKTGSFMSVADIDGPESLLRVREHKREAKAAARSTAEKPKAAPARRPAPRR